MNTNDKLKRLETWLVGLERVAIAFSGGVDSTLLTRIAVDCLPDGNIMALTAVSPSLPESELRESMQLAELLGVQHTLIDTHEVENPDYLENTPQRCYFCKSEVYHRFVDYAKQHGYEHILDGTNADDVGDHRPGRQAAHALGIKSPLKELGFTKDEIRQLARDKGLPNWDKPAAACLSSRIPYGSRINREILSRVERAEEVLKQMGFSQLRVRHHADIARLELEPEAFERALINKERIVEELTALGYLYVTLDLVGFRSGSLNEALKKSHGYRETIPVIQ